MKNVLIVSLNSGGTMGHGRIITSLSNDLVRFKKNVVIASEINYFKHFYLNKNVKKILLPLTDHVNYTIGGMFDYSNKNKILEVCDKERIECVIFSTFFYLELVKQIKSKGIKVILLSYPIRDTFRKALIVNNAYDKFDRVISLYDPSAIIKCLKNEVIVNPLKTVMNKAKKKNNTDITLTCGGGGRPSSKVFINKALNSLKPILTEYDLKVTLIKGNSIINKDVRGIHSIRWSKLFEEIINSSRVIVSEAGYFTMLDLINYNHPAILIPGERIIDNQELRALVLQDLGIGKVFFPFEKKEKLTNLIRESLDEDPNDKEKSFTKIKHDFAKYRDLISVMLEELK